MVKKKTKKEKDIVSLRAEAEEKAALITENDSLLTPEAARHLVHELRVHQIELEMQNEELRKAQLELEDSRDRYMELYDFAPVGYFTFTREALIKEVNLTGAALLGVERQKLIKARFRRFVAPEDHEKWDQHLLSVFGPGERKQSCDLKVRRADGSLFHARLDSIRMDGSSGAFLVRTVMGDISVRKDAEEALKASLERSRSYIEVTGQLGWTTSSEGEVVEDLPTWRKYTGQTCEDIKGWGWTKALHPDDLEQTSQTWKNALASKVDYEAEYRVRRHDGIYRYFLAHGVPVLKEDGSIREWVGTCIDVTERKRIAKELLEYKEYLEDKVKERTNELLLANKTISASNTMLHLFTQTYSRKEYLDSVTENIRVWSGCRCVGIRILDEKGNIPYESYAGFSKEFWEQENNLSANTDQCACIRVITEKPDPQDAPYFSPYGSFYCNNSFELINSMTEEEKKRFRGVCIRNGFLSIAVIPIRYQNKVLGAFHIADEKEDMIPGERVKFIEGIAPIVGEVINRFNVEEDRTRLMAAAESAPDAIVLTDASWKIRYVNPAFESITGYSREEAVGGDHQVLNSDSIDEAVYQAIIVAMNQGQTWKGQLISKKKDGTLYHKECTISPVRNFTGEITNYVSVSRDITEKLTLESVAEAVNSMNNIGYVFSGIRHEIGNPINSIKMTLGVLKRNFDQYNKADILEYVERALAESARVEYLLKTLKNFNMYETPELQNIDMRLFLDSFSSLVKDDLCLRNGIDFRVSIEQAADFCYADPRALQQILLNICNNAADALEGRPGPRIEIKVSKQAYMILIRVEDNGVGISTEKYKDLFKPFYTTKEHGTGLGLVIVRKMLAGMHGTIEISSEQNSGTTVDILIPEAKYA